VRLSTEDIARFLNEETLFHSVAPAALTSLSELATQKAVPKNGIYFSMGHPCEALHFVAEGVGLLVMTSPEGRQRILHRVLPGEMVAAVPFFDGGGYPATFIAESELVMVSFLREKLHPLLTSDPTFAMAVIGGLVERLRMIVSLLEKASFDDVEHRLWDYLVTSSTGPTIGGFPRVLEPIAPREQIASTIGTVREVVSRRLSRLAESGHLQVDGRRLSLLKPLA